MVTELDHHANIAPWRTLEKECGLKVRMVKMIPETGELDWDDFSRQLTRQTKLVALGAASNALGTINDVKRAGEMAHDIGAKIFVDAVHYAPHALIDVRDWNCDFLACSAYKFYGPHIGILYGRRDLLDSLDFPKLIPAPDSAPERAETGTQNHEGIAGAAAAVDFLASLAPGPTLRGRLDAAFRQLHERGDALITQLWNGLREIERVRLYGLPPGAARTPTIAFTINDVPSIEVAKKFGGTRNFPLTRRLLRHDSRRTIGPGARRTCSRWLCLLHHSGRSRSIARCSTRTISQVTPVPTTIALHELVGRNSVEPERLHTTLRRQ